MLITMVMLAYVHKFFNTPPSTYPTCGMDLMSLHEGTECGKGRTVDFQWRDLEGATLAKGGTSHSRSW